MEGLRRDGIPILLVEQNMHRAIGHRAALLRAGAGAVVLEGDGGKPLASRRHWFGSWRSGHGGRRPAHRLLLAAETLERGRVEARASLSVVAEAGFRTVSDERVDIGDAIGQDLEEEAKRMGMQCILLEDLVHRLWRRAATRSAGRRPVHLA